MNGDDMFSHPGEVEARDRAEAAEESLARARARIEKLESALRTVAASNCPLGETARHALCLMKFFMPYRRDNNLNVFGDYDTLVCHVESTDRTQRWYLLHEDSKLRSEELKGDALLEVLRNAFFQQAASQPEWLEAAR